MAGTITEAYGISMLSKKHVLIRNMRKTLSEPDIHGDQIWSSSFLIMDYLLYHRLRPKTRVMELGCGWGLLSVFCAREFDARVTAVDADEKVFPYVHVHAVLNDVRVETRCNRYEKITADDVVFNDQFTSMIFPQPDTRYILQSRCVTMIDLETLDCHISCSIESDHMVRVV